MFSNVSGSRSASIEANREAGRFVNLVLFWMAFALAISGGVAWYLHSHLALERYLLASQTRFIALLLVQFAMVFSFRLILKHFNLVSGILFYALYAVLSGVTISTIFAIFTTQSIVGAFFVTAFAMAGMSAFSFFSKRDFSALGSFAIMGLMGLIGILFLSLFIPSLQSAGFQSAVSVITLIVFSAFTIYDVQRIKRSYLSGMIGGGESRIKASLIGGLSMYINFINLFLALLNLFGGRR